MISVEEALTRITAAFRRLGSERVPLARALGRVLAEDVKAAVNQPPVAVSAMDGYAVRAADIPQAPVTLRVTGEAPAGRAFEGAVNPGEAVRIFTGGPVPEGADAIVIQEKTRREDRAVEVQERPEPGRFIRPAGLDFKAGETGLRKGRRLTARDIGLAAAMNVPELTVTRKPRVAVLTTGDELVPPGGRPGPGQIISSNGPALAAFIAAQGAEAADLGIAGDSIAALKAAAEQAKGSDLLVTTGGVSVGDHDLVREALSEVGFSADFWQVAMRPGKPLLFGHIGKLPVLGFPGNPVSAIVCSVVYLRPAIEIMLGAEAEPPLLRTARLAHDLGANDHRQDYLRAKLSFNSDGEAVAEPFDRQDSAMLAFLAGADCLVVRPPMAPPVKAGSPVPIIVLAGSAA